MTFDVEPEPEQNGKDKVPQQQQQQQLRYEGEYEYEYYTIGFKIDDQTFQCIECKKSDSIEDIIYCDECDEPYHCHCLSPPRNIDSFKPGISLSI